MKTQVSFLISFLFLSVFSFAQAKQQPVVKTEKIKVWGNCGMCKTTIEKAAKAAGANYALWNEEAKILTVKFTDSKTNSSKIEKKVAASGYDTQNETAPDEVYNNLHGCCQYDRKAAEVKEDKKTTASSCCKKDQTCTKDCCKKEDMSCCKTKEAAASTCCKAGNTCCSK